MSILKRVTFHNITKVIFCCLALPAYAKSPYEIDLNVDGQTGNRGYTSLESAINTLSSTSGLRSLVPSYTDQSSAAAIIDLGGLGSTAAFAQGLPTLTVSIPGAGIVNKTFTGATRAASAQQFLDFLRGQGASSSLGHALANTFTNPVAGPNGLMNKMIESDFGRALSDATGSSPASAGFEARYGSFSGAGFNSQGISLPLDYSWRLSERNALELDVPVSITDTGGAKSYSANLGVLWRHRVLSNWTLQPSVRIGGVGSRDLGSGSGVWSAALNSTVNFDLPASWQLTLANGITYISTIPVTVGKVSFNYNLSNVVFRNGLVASRDLGFRLLNLPMRGSVYVIDTRFTGDTVFMKSYQEFGFFAAAGSIAPVRLGAAYLLGDHGVHGFTVSTGVRF